MRLAPTTEQAGFAAAVHDLLAKHSGSWRRAWERLAEIGVTGLAVPERCGGAGASTADLVVAAEELGHHALAGPVAESMGAVPVLLAGLGTADRWLPELAAGRMVATLAAPPWLPWAADAPDADLVLLAETEMVRSGRAGTAYPSVDLSRQLAEVSPIGVVAAGPQVAAALGRALDVGTLVCAAQLLGAGRALLETSIGYAKRRTQFGRPIGQFQAVQHQLADVAVGLEFARPLLYAAAVSMTPRDVSAAKVTAGVAAQRAARTALRVHGAIGYTQEHGLGRWLTKVRVLTLAWGTPAQHRARILRDLTGGS